MRCLEWTTRAGLAAMAAMCVFNFVLTPHFECLLDGDSCDEHVSLMAGIYARSVSVTCLVSVAVAWHEYRGTMATYLERAGLHDAYAAPVAGADAAAADRPRYVDHATFTGAVLYANLALIVPINAFRLYRLVTDGRPAAVILYFVLMYSQNLYVCLYETYFVRLFYALYTRFADINREMQAVGERIVDGRRRARGDSRPPPGRDCWIPHDGDDGGGHRSSYRYYSAATGQPLVDAIERFRIRHMLVCEAVDALKPTFAVPIGLSLCNLCVMALFDVYYHLKNSDDRPAGDMATVYIILWLGQYTFRFFVVTMTVDTTVKQAVGVCITYLVILLQFRIKVDNVY